jgi:hypothetical protein
MEKRNMQNMPRDGQEQGILEGIVVSSSTTSPNQEADEDALRPSITASIPPQHYVLRDERKKKKEMQQSQGNENETDDAESQQPGVKKMTRRWYKLERSQKHRPFKIYRAIPKQEQSQQLQTVPPSLR